MSVPDLFVLCGAALVVAGTFVLAGLGAALVAAGAALILLGATAGLGAG